MFAVTLANFLMFTVSGKNTVKCLEGFHEKFEHCKYLTALQISDKITHELRENFRIPPRKSLVVFGHLRKSLEIFDSRSSVVFGSLSK